MRKGKMRAWRLDDFNDCASDEERDDLAWPVPDVRGILNPDAVSPVEDVDVAAEKFAEHCHARRDGWEWRWPQEFVIHDGAKFWKVEVDRETVPEFNAFKPVEMSPPCVALAQSDHALTMGGGMTCADEGCPECFGH